MLAWLAPAWLAAAAAVLLPLALHLWSRGQARRVRVGSVAWLRPAESLRGRRFRPSDPALLAARVAFWLLLALALAMPRWRPEGGAASNDVDWVLLAPEVVAESAVDATKRAALDETISSFRARTGRDVERRWLSSGFGPVGKRVGGGPRAEPLWSWLIEADEAAPAGASFLVIAPLRIAGLGGERPRLDRPVEVVAWSGGAEQPRSETVAARGGRGLALMWLGDWKSRPEEREYVQAGVEAAAAALDIEIRPVERGDAAEVSGPFAAAVLAGEGTLLGLGASAPSVPCNQPQLVRAGGVEHTFSRALCAAGGAEAFASAGEIRGRDGFGAPWLTVLPRSGGEVWSLELTPRVAVSDLVASAAWPALLADVLHAAARRHGVLPSPPADARPADPRQATPGLGPAVPGSAAAPSGLAWPETAAWLGVAALAVAERRMAARRSGR